MNLYINSLILLLFISSSVFGVDIKSKGAYVTQQQTADSLLTVADDLFQANNIEDAFDAFSDEVEGFYTLVDEVEEKDPVVSLIVISGKNKMAMIEGAPVKEGEYYDDKRIVKIEPDRVLLKNVKSKWVYIGE